MSEELDQLRKKLIGTDIEMITSSEDCKFSYFEYGLKIEQGEKEDEILLKFGMLRNCVKGKEDSCFVQQVYSDKEINSFLTEEIEFLQELIEENQLSDSLLNDIKKYAELCN